MNNGQNSPPLQTVENKPLALARPAVYIEVFVGGQMYAYKIDVAEELYTQLGLAIAGAKSQPDDQTNDKTPQKSPKSQRRSLRPKVDGVLKADVGGRLPPAA